MYYHSIPLKNIRYGWLTAHPRYSDKSFQNAYLWLERYIGYYPLFLAVGNDATTPYEMTGFNANFKTRITGYGKKQQKPVNCRNPDPLPNMVLFRFERSAFETLHYQDYDAWYGILTTYGFDATEEEWNSPQRIRFIRRLSPVIFKHQWSEELWLEKVRKKPGTVQAITPAVDLRLASRIYCKNRKTMEYLRRLGFQSLIKYKPPNFETPLPFL